MPTIFDSDCNHNLYTVVCTLGNIQNFVTGNIFIFIPTSEIKQELILIFNILNPPICIDKVLNMTELQFFDWKKFRFSGINNNFRLTIIVLHHQVGHYHFVHISEIEKNISEILAVLILTWKPV